MRTIAFLALAFAAACKAGVGGAETTPVGPAPGGIYPPRDLLTRRPLTRPEKTSFTETSRHADVMLFLDSLKASNSSRYLSVGTLGRTSQGKDIPMVIMSRPIVRTAAEAKRLNRPIVYLQGNIHGGEVEGKEALLALLRDLSSDQYLNVMDSLVIVAVPIYNADGNDALGPQERNRTEQNGPALIGQRPNGQGLDLNRDYIKAEAPETRASIEFFRAWDPDVFVDLHTTDGSYHGYALTWAPPLNPASFFSGPFTRDTILPAVRSFLRDREHIETFPYGNFASQDSVDRGWFTYDHRPRFGVNYYGLRGRVAILSEAYSHDTFRDRIISTYSFVSELLSFIAANHEDFVDLGRDADRKTTAFASTRNASPPIAIRSRLTRTPRVDEMRIEEVLKTGDSVLTEPGLNKGERRTGKILKSRVPIYDRFEPVLMQTLPYAWVIPGEQAALIEPLRRNGLFIERASAAEHVRGETFLVDSVIAERQFQGHAPVRLIGRWRSDSVAVDPGAYIVRAAQPLAILALYLLEPQSDDGLTTWNFLDAWIRPGAPYPVVRLLAPPTAPLAPAR